QGQFARRHQHQHLRIRQHALMKAGCKEGEAGKDRRKARSSIRQHGVTPLPASRHVQQHEDMGEVAALQHDRD
ncbi:unnamed protein product, partial [Ectocarpus sp. 12 AP-2014]